MAKNDFVAVPEFTIANITGFFTLRIIGALGMDITAAFPATAPSSQTYPRVRRSKSKTNSGRRARRKNTVTTAAQHHV
jgi:hypothetical protein